MRLLNLLIGLIGSLLGAAQVQSGTALELVGAEPADRQVLGLADPSANDAAVSLEAARAGTMSFATISGTEQLTGDLVPTPTSYSPGMMVTLLPAEANASEPTLDLNGLGPRPLVKWGLVPLDSADLMPGSPARVIYDGSRFLLLNNVSRPCRTGFQVNGPSSCIGENPLPATANFFDATLTCQGMGARLCGMGEWVHACRHLPGFLGTLVTPEWVDDGANSASDGKVLGAGWSGGTEVSGFACTYANTFISTMLVRFRCCHSR